MSTDRDLLRAYAETCSEAAFAELVKRYANLVYSVGLRKCADPTLAEDVTQQVFIDLARKAGSLSAVVVLSAWLHRAACYAAAEECRARHRREKREQVATEMNLLDSETDPPWSAIKPELDDALNELASSDREALLLRFFEQCSHAQIGLAFQVSEDAARKRVDRALDRLRSVLAGRGVTASAAALSAALIANSVQAAPATFIAGLTTASLAGFGGKTTTLTLITMSKLKTTAAAALILVGAGTPFLLQLRQNHRLRAEIEQLRQNAITAANNQSSPLSPESSEELKRPRNEHAELLRLRGEIALLRNQTQLSSATSTGASLTLPPAPQTYPNVIWNADSWKNAGTHTVDAAFETLLWSAKSGDTQFMKALIYWDGQVEPGQIADWEKSVLNTVQSYIHAVTNYTGVRLLSQTEVDPNTRILRFEAIGVDTPSTSTDLTFRKTDKGWRQLIADQ